MSVPAAAERCLSPEMRLPPRAASVQVPCAGDARQAGGEPAPTSHAALRTTNSHAPSGHCGTPQHRAGRGKSTKENQDVEGCVGRRQQANTDEDEEEIPGTSCPSQKKVKYTQVLTGPLQQINNICSINISMISVNPPGPRDPKTLTSNTTMSVPAPSPYDQAKHQMVGVLDKFMDVWKDKSDGNPMQHQNCSPMQMSVPAPSPYDQAKHQMVSVLDKFMDVWKDKSDGNPMQQQNCSPMQMSVPAPSPYDQAKHQMVSVLDKFMDVWKDKSDGNPMQQQVAPAVPMGNNPAQKQLFADEQAKLPAAAAPSGSGGVASNSAAPSGASAPSSAPLEPLKPRLPCYCVLDGHRKKWCKIDGVKHILDLDEIRTKQVMSSGKPRPTQVGDHMMLLYRKQVHRIIDLGSLDGPHFAGISVGNSLLVRACAGQGSFIEIAGVGMVAVGELAEGETLHIKGRLYTLTGNKLVVCVAVM